MLADLHVLIFCNAINYSHGQDFHCSAFVHIFHLYFFNWLTCGLKNINPSTAASPIVGRHTVKPALTIQLTIANNKLNKENQICGRQKIFLTKKEEL